ncbi:MAG: right-handed parallel beta-helix repeat-containing protein, partial [Verrucomicrobiales bacterium]
MKLPESIWIWALTLLAASLHAADLHVAKTGSDNAQGSEDQPFLTIQRAAELAQPGDTIWIHEGTYREWVRPPRGGISEEKRITYRAVPGDLVEIKGSERVTSWAKGRNKIWTVEIPDKFFGGFNPFKLKLPHKKVNEANVHLGLVYLNGVSYREVGSLKSVEAGKFFVEAKKESTVLHASFADANPILELTEINVRECVFFPLVKGLKYITIDGLTMRHSAANWLTWRRFGRAMVGTYRGQYWIIENCTLSDARCTAICDNDPSSEHEGFDIDEVGSHIIRNNHIYRCGEAGIHGFKGWSKSVIEGNLIEEINFLRQFGGWDQGGMKLMNANEVIVRNNVVRRVYRTGPGKTKKKYNAIWLDSAIQNCRITGNVVYDHEADSALFLQNGHGPTLVDNNILEGNFMTSMKNSVLVHNLFVDSRFDYYQEPKAWDPVYYRPHTAEVVKRAPLEFLHDKIFNNIFSGSGIRDVARRDGFQSDYNVFYGKAEPTIWGDENSEVNRPSSVDVQFKSLPNGVEVRFQLDEIPSKGERPLITGELFGNFPVVDHGLEGPDGRPVSVDHDMTGAARNPSRPTA